MARPRRLRRSLRFREIESNHGRRLEFREGDEYTTALDTPQHLAHWGELTLLMTVLEDGVHEALQLAVYGKRAWRKRKAALRRRGIDAWAWLFSDDISYFYSAQAIADSLDVDLAMIRRKALKRVGMTLKQLRMFVRRECLEEGWLPHSN